MAVLQIGLSSGISIAPFSRVKLLWTGIKLLAESEDQELVGGVAASVVGVFHL